MIIKRCNRYVTGVMRGPDVCPNTKKIQCIGRSNKRAGSMGYVLAISRLRSTSGSTSGSLGTREKDRSRSKAVGRFADWVLQDQSSILILKVELDPRQVAVFAWGQPWEKRHQEGRSKLPSLLVYVSILLLPHAFMIYFPRCLIEWARSNGEETTFRSRSGSSGYQPTDLLAADADRNRH